MFTPFRISLAAIVGLAVICTPAIAATVTLDFDAPDFAVGQSVNRVGDINILPAGTVFAPANIPTFTGTQALRSPGTCANAACTNNAYRMEFRFGDALPMTNGWLYKPASRVSLRVGVNATGQWCFPEGSTCAMYASVHAYDRDGNPAAAPQDVFLFDAFTAQTVPITREIVVADPLARIARVVLTYGKGTVSHDIGFPGEPQIDHLVVEFPDTPPATGPLPAAPSIQITEPSGSRSAPYNVHLRGSVNAPGGITAFCYRLNQALPSGTGCANLNLLQANNTFDIVIPDQDLAPGANTLSVRVYDAHGQVATQNATVHTLAPPPPVVTVLAPASNTWLNPAVTNNLVGNVRTVGAIKGFCLRIDNPALPAPAACTQNTSAVNNSNPSYQPLSFTASLAPSSIPSGQHTVSLFAVDRWNQVGRADLTLNAPTDLRVVAMEITQGIQTFDLPLNTTGSTPYSGVNLRQGVPTVVRVFANSAFAGNYTGVSMLLNGFQAAPGGGESSLGGLLPSSSPTLRIGPIGVTTEIRHDPAGGFVFTLPNHWTVTNGLRLEAKLLLPFGLQECAGCASNNQFSVTHIGFGPAVGVTISPVALTFTDPVTGAFISPPPPAGIFAPAANIAPVPPASFVVRPFVGTIDVSSVVGTGGGCRAMNTTCQDAIHGMVWSFNISSPQPGHTIGVGAIDIGLDIAGLVRRPPYGQFEFGHIAIADTRAPMLSVAHEFFHMMGYFHASSCGDSDLFNMWPPDQQGFIHGVGLNRTRIPDAMGVWNGRHNILMPGTDGLPGGTANYFDLMSYCASESTAWISVKNWNTFGGALPNGLIPDSLIFGTATATIKNNAAASRQAFETKSQVLLTSVVLDAEHRAVFTRVRRADGWLHEDPPGSEYSFVVRDARLNEVARVPATVTMRHEGKGAASSLFVSGYLPAEGAAVVELEFGDKVVARIARSRNAPKLEVSPLETEWVSRDGKVELQWAAYDEDKDALEARIEFSAGPEEPFRSVYLGPNHGKWTIPGSLLSASNEARLRVVITDGFNEAEQVTAPFVVRAAPPLLEIKGVADGASYPQSTPIRMQAAAFGDGQLPLDGKNIRWVVDGREAGYGMELELLDREPGRHFVQVYAREGKLESALELSFFVHPNQ